ncbi:B12-binding domain-containing radical SAM protein [Solidesulfovibrio sp.]|uniref:B12-binding domain-containing radical SAM protein n=1 Tax=Solidesulfovibrio sp. TaxID=2910990 RepID=UPI002B21D56A|nr:radical SAM protein [Solidesulfovibrio sp.]MEA5090922.1 radical SAM protein [Solidesulfovibrio sp.]
MSLPELPRFSQDAKILFIIHDVYQDDNLFPSGVAYLAAVLRDLGASVEICCMDLYHYSNAQLEEKLRDAAYDLIGVGFMAARFKETILDLCASINRAKKDAWLVLGAHGPSPIPEYVLKTTRADVVAMGEAELTLPELLFCKVNGRDLRGVPGLAYRIGDEVVVNPRRKPVAALDALPFPAWDLFPIETYMRSVVWPWQESGEKSLNFSAGRGCINKCNFCYRMERGLRVRSVENIVSEVKILYNNYGINNFYINDELFVFKKERIFDFEKQLEVNDIHIKFGCDARVDIIDRELLESLKRCGCKFLCIGFESASDEVLRLMNKNTTYAQNIRALEAITAVGNLGVGLNFLWNNLGDDEKTLLRNVELIKTYNNYDQLRTIRPVTPYPGSDLYYKAVDMGLLTGPEDFFDRFVNSDLLLVNFMDIPTERVYELLLEANTDLINDHFRHTSGDMQTAQTMIQQFADLYSGKITNFRGARHYKKHAPEKASA